MRNEPASPKRSGMLVMLVMLGACGREPPSEVFPGVRLGMAPRDVRERLPEGVWRTVPGLRDDTVLEWNAPPEGARFEFHQGMLVAVRAHVRTKVSSERVEVTAQTVMSWSPSVGGQDGSDVTLLARDCPTHQEEARSLAARVRERH